MTDMTKDPMEKFIREAARSVEPRREFSDALWAEMQTARKVNQPLRRSLHFSRPAWGLTFAALALAVTCAAYGPQNVLAAVKNLIGYIPGIGFVQQDESTLYLSKPVSVTQKGVTLTVEQAVADANGIVISYHMDGLPEPKPGETYTCVYSDNRLRLPDGKDLLPIGGGLMGAEARIEFAPLPSGVKQVALVTRGESDCPAPIDWTIDIPLGTAAPQPSLPVLDVAPVTTPAGTSSQQANEQVKTGNPAANDQVRISVEKTVPLPDGWLITGHVTWDDPEIMNMYVPPEMVTVTDAAGKNIPVEPTDTGYNDGEFGFILKQTDIQSPVKLTIRSILVNGMLENGPDFSFNTGRNPQPGQEWMIDKTLDVFGMPVDVVKVTPAGFEDGSKGYAVTLRIPETISNIDLRYVTKTAGLGSFGEGRPLADHLYEIKMGFPGDAPVGELTFAVFNVQWNLGGNWETSWNMPPR